MMITTMSTHSFLLVSVGHAHLSIIHNVMF